MEIFSFSVISHSQRTEPWTRTDRWPLSDSNLCTYTWVRVGQEAPDSHLGCHIPPQDTRDRVVVLRALDLSSLHLRQRLAQVMSRGREQKPSKICVTSGQRNKQPKINQEGKEVGPCKTQVSKPLFHHTYSIVHCPISITSKMLIQT